AAAADQRRAGGQVVPLPLGGPPPPGDQGCELGRLQGGSALATDPRRADGCLRGGRAHDGAVTSPDDAACNVGRGPGWSLPALAVAALEPVDAAAGVHQLLLAGVEGVAL